MAVVSHALETALREIVGDDRLSVDGVERKLYSSDIGAMPKLVKPLMPTGVAGAVVRPRTEAQIQAIVRLAAREGIKLVPRGMSTSGYGGVLPLEGAVVVDMSAMGQVLELDPTAKT